MGTGKIRSGLKVKKDHNWDTQVWKELIGYSGRFQVSNIGNVCIVNNKFERKVLPARVDKRERGGYLTVKMNHGGKSETRFVHRLVAEAFVPNHMKKPIVNHRNGNKLDNRPKNLEWVTHAENVQHAHDLRLIPRPTEKKVIDTSSDIVYPSIKEASKQTGMPYPTIKGYLKGTRRNKTSLIYLND
jgi:hypothetical protein